MDQSQTGLQDFSKNPDPNKINMSQRRYKLYCEDDYFHEECSRYYHLRCDHKIQELPTPFRFNYPRFTQYLRLKTKIELRNRMAEASSEIVSLGLDHFTDERLQEELFGIYGEMDESSERYAMIFENYKLQRLEQIKEWTEVANKNATGEILENERSEFIDEDEELLRYFSIEEITEFKSLSRGENPSIEPFLLPRKRRKDFNNKSKNVDKRKQKNMKNQNHADLVTVEVTRIICQYPLGLTIDLFLKKCQEGLDKQGYRGPAMNAGMLERSPLKDILFTKKYNSSYLAFPSALQLHLLPNPLQILGKLKHKLLAILNLSYGIIEVNECVQLLNRLFQIDQFNCHNWGFQTEKDFVKVIFDKWKSANVEVIELPINGKTNSYLAVVTKKSHKLIESKLPAKQSHTLPLEDPRKLFKGRVSLQQQLHNKSVQQGSSLPSSPSTSSVQNSKFTPSSSTHSPWSKTPQLPSKPPPLNYDPSATSIDPKYVQLGDKMFEEQTDIERRAQMSCVVSLVNSPTDFYLVRQVKWKELNSLHRDLGNYWLSDPVARCPHPRFIQKNYICMAKSKVNDGEEEDVYRVQILRRPDPSHYQVFCVDYGDLLIVQHDQLRYLPKDLLLMMEAQAISCSLYNVASPTKDPTTGDDVWSKDVCDFTNKLFLPKGSDDYTPTVKVLFKERVNGNGKWLVKVSSPKSPDFGEDIMRFVNRKK